MLQNGQTYFGQNKWSKIFKNSLLTTKIKDLWWSSFLSVFEKDSGITLSMSFFLIKWYY